MESIGEREKEGKRDISAIPGSTALYHDTYHFEPLYSILADVHASGFLHLHVAQVLGGRKRVENEKYCDKSFQWLVSIRIK